LAAARLSNLDDNSALSRDYLTASVELDEKAWAEFEKEQNELESSGSRKKPRKYIFGTHPHGSFGSGTFASFLASVDFPRLFPNLVSIEKGYCHLRGTTISFQFIPPFVRELTIGAGSSSLPAKR
jgi:hypothetical protein